MYVLENTGNYGPIIFFHTIILFKTNLNFDLLFLSFFVVKKTKGGFVKKHGVETGDSLTVYEDESKNLVSSLFNYLFLCDFI